MHSCKHGKLGSSWRQQIVLGLLSIFSFPRESVQLRTGAPCASEASPSVGAVCPEKKTDLGRSLKNKSQLSRALPSALYLILLYPFSSLFGCKNSHPCPSPDISLLPRKYSFGYNSWESLELAQDKEEVLLLCFLLTKLCWLDISALTVWTCNMAVPFCHPAPCSGAGFAV